MISLELINHTRQRMPKKLFSELIAFLGHEFKSKRLFTAEELSVVFVSSAQMKKLNKQHRGKSYATDILSFGAGEEFGELILCPEVISKNARRSDLAQMSGETKWSLEKEYTLMIIHGLLHLAGMDHSEEARSTEPMLKLQRKLFQKWQVSA